MNRTITVTAANAPLARALAAALSAGGVGMFESPLPPESLNTTHFISSGQIDDAFDALLPKQQRIETIVDGQLVVTWQEPDQETKNAAAERMFAAVGGMATLAQCQNLIDTSVVVDCDVESAEATIARLNLSGATAQ